MSIKTVLKYDKIGCSTLVWLPTLYWSNIERNQDVENPLTLLNHPLDQTGVGELKKISIEKGKSTQSNLKFGICGEQDGDP